MPMTTDALHQHFLSFMTVLHDCYSRTTYSNDRSLYATGLATAMGWIVDLQNGTEVSKVIEHICDPQTDKQFGDYWKQGDWGDKESHALERLRANIQP